jgi:hypothetical protein
VKREKPEKVMDDENVKRNKKLGLEEKRRLKVKCRRLKKRHGKTK